MDTGVGAKGYSIIAQGEIQKIVNAKPEDRRVLIEEAAGIAKYKARKKESLRKIESAHANLSRLNDVVSEIERSLNSLERQAGKASQYKKFKEELLDKEMAWGRRKNRVLRIRLDELKAKRETLEQELSGLKAELSTAELSIETDRIEQLTLSKSTEELQSMISDRSGDLTRAQSALDLSRRRQSDLSTQLEMLTSEKADLEVAIVTEKEKITGLSEESENAGEELNAASVRVSEQDETTRVARSETEMARKNLDSANRDLMNGIAKARDLTSRIPALKPKIESAGAQIERLGTQTSHLAEKIETARVEHQRIASASEEALHTKTKLQHEARETASSVEAKERNLRDFRRGLEDSNRTLVKQKSKLQSLEELTAALEGYGDGPRSVLDWAKENGRDSALRALAEGLDIDAGFEAALEGFLEGKLETLVTEDAACAIDALRSLATQSKGRSGILIANGDKSSKPSAAIDAMKNTLSAAGFSVLGTLSSFVKANSKLTGNTAKAAIGMLDSAIVVESMDALPEYLKSNSNFSGFSSVSKDGFTMDPD